MQETYQDQSFRDTNLGLSAELSIPLYQGGLLNSRTRQARLESDRARYNRMSVERDVTAQVTSAWHTVIAAREAIAASISQVDAAEVALEGAEQELAVGTRITLDVLDQERELLEARLGARRCRTRSLSGDSPSARRHGPAEAGNHWPVRRFRSR